MRPVAFASTALLQIGITLSAGWTCAQKAPARAGWLIREGAVATARKAHLLGFEFAGAGAAESAG